MVGHRLAVGRDQDDLARAERVERAPDRGRGRGGVTRARALRPRRGCAPRRPAPPPSNSRCSGRPPRRTWRRRARASLPRRAESAGRDPCGSGPVMRSRVMCGWTPSGKAWTISCSTMRFDDGMIRPTRALIVVSSCGADAVYAAVPVVPPGSLPGTTSPSAISWAMLKEQRRRVTAAARLSAATVRGLNGC